MDLRAGERFGASRLGSLRRWLSGLTARRALVPAGGLATLLVIAVAVGVYVREDGGGTASELSGGGDSAVESLEGAEPAKRAAEGSSGEAVPFSEISPDDARNAPGREKRRQDRSAALTLETDTGEVRDVSDRAIQITESAGGVVLSSQLTELEGQATAVLELQVPTRELDSTLDQLTDLATVESLNEAAVDITRPFVSARDRLRDARAERKELLRALGNASTDEETEAIRKQLGDVRREISRAEAAFDSIARRARNSQVSLRIDGTPGGGGWSLGDAADDALGALKFVAGVMLVAAAILAPIVLLVLAVVLVARAIRKSRRERALDGE
jgi:hypothetical protein